MVTSVGFQSKQMFFDRQAVIDAVGKANARTCPRPVRSSVGRPDRRCDVANVYRLPARRRACTVATPSRP